MTFEELQVIITAQTSEFLSAIRKVKDKVKDVEKAAENIGKNGFRAAGKYLEDYLEQLQKIQNNIANFKFTPKAGGGL